MSVHVNQQNLKSLIKIYCFYWMNSGCWIYVFMQFHIIMIMFTREKENKRSVKIFLIILTEQNKHKVVLAFVCIKNWVLQIFPNNHASDFIYFVWICAMRLRLFKSKAGPRFTTRFEIQDRDRSFEGHIWKEKERQGFFDLNIAVHLQRLLCLWELCQK